MEQQVFHHTLPNGMVLLAERMGHVRSAAINFLVPAGAAFDPPGKLGLASVLAGLLPRGAGDLDSRAHTLALDNLGVDRSESVRAVNTQLWGSTLARNIPPALELFADVVRRPHLPDDELEPVKALALQDLQSLEDSPQGKVMVELRRRYYPAPLNHDRRGTTADVVGVTAADVRNHFARHFRPNGTILSVAGNLDWPVLKAQVERLFGDWQSGDSPAVTPATGHKPASGHITKDTQQTQIALACPSASVPDPEYYAARAAVGVLSGGMSSRLFTEVREKRGLCYAVSASHESYRDRGTLFAYADPPAAKAEETLAVLLKELTGLKDGVSADEVDRVKAGLKSSLIMQNESSAARAGAIATDWYYLNRVRTFDEIRAAINGLTPAAVVGYLDKFPITDVTLVTLGPDPVPLPA